MKIKTYRIEGHTDDTGLIADEDVVEDAVDDGSVDLFLLDTLEYIVAKAD